MDLTSIKGALSSARQRAEAAAEKAGVRQRLKDLSASARKAASGAYEAGKSRVLGELNVVRDYDVSPEVTASGGLGGVFSVHDGVRRRTKAGAQDARVSVWLLDKRALLESHAKDDVEALVNLVRKDAAQWIKLRHPSILRLHAPPEENRNALALVTEPVLASMTDVLAKGANLAEKRRAARRSLRAKSGKRASSSSSSSKPKTRGGGGGGGGAAARGGDIDSDGDSDGDTSRPPAHLADLRLSKLEIKHGTLQLAEGLRFLHEGAKLVHRAFGADVAALTAEGQWKIAGGFGHALPADGNGDGMLYPDTSRPALGANGIPLDPLPLTPRLAYVAPELILGARGSRGGGGGHSAATPAADVFSLGALHYELLTGKKWLEIPDQAQTVGEYEGAVAKTSAASHGNGAAVDAAAAAAVRAATARDPSLRPCAGAFAASQYFANDPGLAALAQLDRFLELDVLARAAFLQSLQGRWDLFDSRVLVTRVLPPLLVELRTPQLQPLVLPIILQLCERQTPGDFTNYTLPYLAPLLESASGATLGTVLRHASAFAGKVTSAAEFEARVLPAVLRGVDAPEVMIQEEALRQIARVAGAGSVSAETMRERVVPRVRAVATRATAAAVRVNALVVLGKTAPGCRPEDLDATLATLRAILEVDRSAATLMCAIGVADAVGRAGGGLATATRALPLAAPLLAAPGLNKRQLTTILRVVRGMVDRVEAERMPDLPEGPPPTPPTPAPRAKAGLGSGTTAAAPNGDPFAASASVAAPPPAAASPGSLKRLSSIASPELKLAPPPGFGGARVDSSDQLAAALSSPDDLAALFTEPGYAPRPLAFPNVGGGSGRGAGGPKPGAAGSMFVGLDVNQATGRGNGGVGGVGGSLL